MSFYCTTPVQSRVQHANAEVEDRQRPDTANSEAHTPYSAVMGFVTCHEHNQED